jgi:hypothetical protein
MNYHINKLDIILSKLLNIVKTDERAFKQEKGSVLLI